MPDTGYNLFCPVAKACEILEPRWTLLILCEMWFGSCRFNDIKRGVPGMSPTLLTKRLKEMVIKGLITREEDKERGSIVYKVTKIGYELEPIVQSLGLWAHRNIDSEATLASLDANVLMWNIRRNINIAAIKPTKTIIQFMFPELEKELQNYWMIIKPGCQVDLCLNDPSFDVDLYIKADLKALTSVWIGFSELKNEIMKGEIVLTGDQDLATSMDNWMARSLFAS